jgi:flagellar M-ring protein FliF
MFAQLRAQFVQFWNRLSQVQRTLLVGLVVLAAILIPLIFTWASTPSYAVAFSGMSEADAGQITQKLDAEGIPYQVRGGTTILVPSDKVYSVRLEMATAGLPAGGNVGFEIFSGNTFGMTDFTQKVNYQRALEGELERTIGSLNSIEAVRVHIVTPEQTLLSQSQMPTTASVTVKTRPGSALDSGQVKAITHLLASSVEGMTPENVTVVDTNGNMLSTGLGDGTDAISGQSDSRRAAEAAYAADIEQRIKVLLDSALGPNRSVVKATVNMDWTQRETTSQIFDPTKSAVRSSEKINESSTTNGGTTGGVPGSASNLPTAAATASASTSGASTYTHSQDTINYEVSSTSSKEVSSPGQLQRISLSVLVDGVTDTKQLDTLQKVIAAAAGIDTARGDVLAVQSLSFDKTYVTQQQQDLASSESNALYLQIAEIVGAVLLVAAVLWYVQRLLNNLKVASSDAWTPVLRPASELALSGGMSLRPQLESGSMSASGPPELNSPVVRQQIDRIMAKTQTATPEDDQLQKLVARIAEDNPASVAEIIQLWLSKEER